VSYFLGLIITGIALQLMEKSALVPTLLFGISIIVLLIVTNLKRKIMPVDPPAPKPPPPPRSPKPVKKPKKEKK